MNSRITPHQKVRSGCTQCKKRHIKCDESGPACRNCVRYGSACSYSIAHNSPSGLKSLKVEFNLSEGYQFSCADLELLHHWTISTSESLATNTGLQRILRDVIPRLAVSHNYLLHAILALSSLHIVYLRPADSEQYLIFAAHHQSLAISLVRLALTCMDEDNCHALFACSHIMSKYAFASFSKHESRVFSPDSGTVLEFIPLLRGAFSIHDYALEWLSVGPLSFCLRKRLEKAPEFKQIPDDAYLGQLLSLLATDDSEDTKACCEALNILRRLFSKAAAPNCILSARSLAYSWPVEVPQRYITLVHERKPEALVVMAHYCVMLKMIDSFWYVRGNALRVLDQCRKNLSDKWLPHIDWPLSIVGLPVDK